MIYLDNAATTVVCQAAAQKALHMMTECFGNPSSLHTAGIDAEREMDDARQSVAKLIGAKAEDIYFTSGGTEANNIAVLGGAAATTRVGRHIVTTAVEHACVSACCDELEKQGYEITRLFPDENGIISAQTIADACRADTALVSIMTVNNETGARFPIEDAAPLIRKRSPKALIHTDAVQAAGKLPIFAQKSGIDLLTMSGHKIHAPKGVGAIYVRHGVRLIPRVLGGGQERGLRSGTEATPAIAAFGAAAKCVPDLADQQKHFERLHDRLLNGLKTFSNVKTHLPDRSVPYLVNISMPGYKSETLVHFLAERDVYVSGGSACSKGKQSPVLKAMGLPSAEIDSALRISFCRDTKEEDIDRFLYVLHEAEVKLTKAASFHR